MQITPACHFVLRLSAAGLALTGAGHAAAGAFATASRPMLSTPLPGEAPAETALAWGDIDGDGLQDALAIGALGDIRLLLNFGEGRFEDITEISGLSVLSGASCAMFSDLDGDGRADLFLGSSEQRVWRNRGDGTFEAIAAGIDHDLIDLGARAVDQDGDGNMDLQIHTEAGDLVYRNLGTGQFELVKLPLGDASVRAAGISSLAKTERVAADSHTAIDSLDSTGRASLADRRLSRWRTSIELGTSTSLMGTPGAAGSALQFCLPGIRDAASADCIGASSEPALGKLYPLGTDFYVDAIGSVGIGTSSPNSNWALDIDDVGAGTQWSGGVAAGSSSGRRVVLGELDGDAVVGAHSGDLSSWDELHAVGTQFTFETTVGGRAERMVIDSSGRVGIGTTAPTGQLHVQGPGGLLVTGQQGVGPIPVQGAGSRVMWHQGKHAFRAGRVGGSEWDDSVVGFSSVALGSDTQAGPGTCSAALGGCTNVASGFSSTTVGGNGNEALGETSLAAGNRAKANHDGSFVWGDRANVDKPSSAANQFNVYSGGGVRIFSSSNGSSGVVMGAGGGSWSTVSDRNAKENFEPIDGRDVLARLATVPISTWNYKTQDDETRHMGPMAQDFWAAFELGLGDTRIDTIDPDGVALAAIQGLNSMVEELRAANEELHSANSRRDDQIDRLRTVNEELATRMQKLESIASEVSALTTALAETRR